MAFAKVDSQADFPALEREVLSFWQSEQIFEKLRAQNLGKKKWSFLDGPITANNPMGVHHAWGRTYKDVFNRYFAMSGHELRYQNGFDCQGLWVEVEVEKELGLKSKRDIEELVPGDREASIAHFVQLCKDRVDKFARIQTEQSIRLGMWMDWDTTDADWAKPVDERKSYFTMSNENNYTIWSFLKKCHGKGMIYRGYDAMPWCGRCGVGLSEMEVKEGYKTIEHHAVFVKFPLRDRPNECLLAWTTTPWTLTSNVAAAVNPELTYLRIKLKNEIYYVGKGAFKINRMESSGAGEDGEPGEATAGKKSKRDWLDGVPHLKSIEQLFKEKAGKDGFEIVGYVKGAEMVGWAYNGPFDDLEAQNVPGGYPEHVVKTFGLKLDSAAKAHQVIRWDAVGETEGTGIVHIAPGCGQSDLLLVQFLKLTGSLSADREGTVATPVIAPLDDSGHFLEGFGPFSGLNASLPSTADRVFEELKARDRLFATERYAHRYPHCWRCKSELLYRLVDEWYISMGQKPSTIHVSVGSHEFATRESWKPSFRTDIKNVVEKVTFLPESLSGQKREIDWLGNMGDWMISKKRYWGLALPIWVDEETGEFVVLDLVELKKWKAAGNVLAGWDDFLAHSPHRPFVDRLKLCNPNTGNVMSRVPDVGNPWLDAGIVGFSTLKYNTDPAYWKQWYPADFITESFPGQFRNWFYALLALSTMMSDGEPPFKTLLGFATVKDQYGHDMHKTAGNSIEFIAAADKGGITKDAKGNDVPFTAIGADVMRWLYCRQSPAQNLNFGPEPANEVRSKFIFKLWNTYALFCNCAMGDGFDPASEEQRVPAAERSDIDRWILSCLQVLVQTARDSFEKYDAMTFALAAERFVDDDLSNWYVRRVKPRLNSKVADLDAAGLKDKWAAYQTMHGVLTTLCQCLAPCVPFITEVIWKGLKNSGWDESVHLSEFPKSHENLKNPALMEQMEALRDIITLGGAARNVAKIKVRQPLAELIVRTTGEADERAIAQFDQLIRDELNVKKVTVFSVGTSKGTSTANAVGASTVTAVGTSKGTSTVHAVGASTVIGANDLQVNSSTALVESSLMAATAKINKKTAATKLGPKLKEAEAELAKRNALELAKVLRAGPMEIAGIALDTADVVIEYTSAKPGYAGTVDNRGREAVVSTVITEELKLEGMARDVIRLVNQARKDAGLQIADTIALYLHSPSEMLSKALVTQREYIAAETQAGDWSDAPLSAAHASDSKVDGLALRIEFVKL